MPQSRIYFGNPTSNPASEKTVFEPRTLTATEATDKELTLNQLPVSSTEVSMWIVGGSVLVNGSDFTVTGAVVDFSASPYAPLLQTGSQIFFLYNRS
jgi:hypothetical protein